MNKVAEGPGGLDSRTISRYGGFPRPTYQEKGEVKESPTEEVGSTGFTDYSQYSSWEEGAKLNPQSEIWQGRPNPYKSEMTSLINLQNVVGAASLPYAIPLALRLGSIPLIKKMAGTSALDILGWLGLGHGVTHGPEDIKEFAKDPSLETGFNVAMDALGVAGGGISATRLGKSIQSGINRFKSMAKGTHTTTKGDKLIYNPETSQWVLADEPLHLKSMERNAKNIKELRLDAKNQIKGAKEKLKQALKEKENLLEEAKRFKGVYNWRNNPQEWEGFDTKALQQERNIDLFMKQMKANKRVRKSKEIIKDRRLDLKSWREELSGPSMDKTLDAMLKGRTKDLNMLKEHQMKSLFKRLFQTEPPPNKPPDFLNL